MDDATLAALQRAAERAFAGTAVFLAYAYGRRLWGAPRPESDLDVGYYRQPGGDDSRLPLRVELGLAGRLAEAAGVPVDLRDLGDAPLELRGRVLEEGQRIYCRDQVARVNLERDLLGRYHDYKPIFQAMHELRLRQFARGA